MAFTYPHYTRKHVENAIKAAHGGQRVNLVTDEIMDLYIKQYFEMPAELQQNILLLKIKKSRSKTLQNRLRIATTDDSVAKEDLENILHSEVAQIVAEEAALLTQLHDSTNTLRLFFKIDGILLPNILEILWDRECIDDYSPSAPTGVDPDQFVRMLFHAYQTTKKHMFSY